MMNAEATKSTEQVEREVDEVLAANFDLRAGGGPIVCFGDDPSKGPPACVCRAPQPPSPFPW